jgi:alkaline phosphatase D
VCDATWAARHERSPSAAIATREYKTDVDLQRLHASVPWLVTWDDLEVDNNYAGTRSESLDPDFRRRRVAAYRAYFEHMPLRTQAHPTRSGVVLRSRHDFG